MKILVLGLGNILLEDEGVSVRVIGRSHKNVGTFAAISFLARQRRWTSRAVSLARVSDAGVEISVG